MSIIPPANFYLGAPTNINGVSIYRSIEPVSINGAGNIGITSDEGEVISSITSTIPGSSPTSSTVPTTEAVMAYMGGGSGIPVPLILTGNMALQLYLVNPSSGIMYFGQGLSVATITNSVGDLQINSAGVVDITNTIDSTAPTTGALQSSGGLGVTKKIFSGDSVHVISAATKQIDLTNVVSSDQGGMGVNIAGDLELTSDSGTVTVDEYFELKNGAATAQLYLDGSGNLNITPTNNIVNKKTPYYLAYPICYEMQVTTTFTSTGAAALAMEINLTRHGSMIFAQFQAASGTTTSADYLYGIGAIPATWRPLTETEMYISGGASTTDQPFRVYIASNGDFKLSYRAGSVLSNGISVRIFKSCCRWQLD